MNDGQAALIYSLGLHVTVATVAWVGIPLMKEDRTPTEPPPIMIDFVEIAEQTAAPDPVIEAPEKEVEKKSPPKETNYAKKEAAPVAASEALPTLEKAKKKEPVKQVEKPVVSKLEQVASKMRPSFKPKPPSRLQSSKLAALLDKSVKKETLIDTVETKQKIEAKTEEAKKPLFTDLKSRFAVAALQDAITSKMYGCWNIPSGVKDVHTMQVMIRVQLRPDGTLMRQPSFVSDVDFDSADQAGFRTFAESARRAVQRCAPYDELPADRYSEWKEIDFNFDASEMTR